MKGDEIRFKGTENANTYSTYIFCLINNAVSVQDSIALLSVQQYTVCRNSVSPQAPNGAFTSIQKIYLQEI